MIQEYALKYQKYHGHCPEINQFVDFVLKGGIRMEFQTYLEDTLSKLNILFTNSFKIKVYNQPKLEKQLYLSRKIRKLFRSTLEEVEAFKNKVKKFKQDPQNRDLRDQLITEIKTIRRRFESAPLTGLNHFKESYEHKHLFDKIPDVSDQVRNLKEIYSSSFPSSSSSSKKRRIKITELGSSRSRPRHDDTIDLSMHDEDEDDGGGESEALEVRQTQRRGASRRRRDEGGGGGGGGGGDKDTVDLTFDDEDEEVEVGVPRHERDEGEEAEEEIIQQIQQLPRTFPTNP